MQFKPLALSCTAALSAVLCAPAHAQTDIQW